MIKNKSIDLRKSSKIKTFGNSMYPLLNSGDIIYYKPVDYEDIEVNDLLVIKYERFYITHRVIYKNAQYLITKGDNNLKPDSKITKKEIIGKLTHIKRKDKKINPEAIYKLQSSIYLKEVIKINTELNKNNIEFIILKGLPLHLYLHNSYPRRIYSDCDLLIKHSDFNKAFKVFKNNGYKYHETSFIQTKRKDKIVFNMFKIINGFPVIFDLHLKPRFLMTQLEDTNLFYSDSLMQDMTKTFFLSRRIVYIKKNAFSLLSPEHQIIYLLLHFFHHNFRGMYRLELINKVIMKEKHLKWDEIHIFITNHMLNNFIEPTIHLLQKYFNSEIPLNQHTNRSSFLMKSLENNIFNGELRFESGIKRFIYMVYFSPEPIYKKSLGILDKKIISLGLWVFSNWIQLIFKKLKH